MLGKSKGDGANYDRGLPSVQQMTRSAAPGSLLHQFRPFDCRARLGTSR